MSGDGDAGVDVEPLHLRAERRPLPPRAHNSVPEPADPLARPGAEHHAAEERRTLGRVERGGLGVVARLEEPAPLQEPEHAGGDLAGDDGHLFRRLCPDGVEDRSAVFLPHRVHALQDD